MSLDEVHQELTLIGVSSEVHNLVDDLGLDFGVMPMAYRFLLKHENCPHSVNVERYVYQPRNRKTFVQGKLFD